ncbi:tRNA preQ1(34) S-adenosylmethionine ribosyltransferase-isomerase QueA [Chitinimonas sp. BJB300]|uniref:tRNA preQ1(34) S-adenosylmethionine ribosyltransferase-isomerase QueA n=1 Tax=Chitinimonas sp. BJB300 TaxID=1559339 RepID=UPI000C10EB69|nr:tRNA preQ1(34) S-adenosylmethionine ribosyltransferase-isomerase QueA [Chitinimonas sp. BJB300]PHV11600.1 tRNA preQ1(34) S-adenosylmethionine ribosyltransferase-isomerase QueA [Chitinimonas sp. BJB300]TSJ88088.1 tRNA preQ1(34) S-adenosylmethionine ribosyltransferase-isomerase QueA [Chitinimonas sp. BJB300]
MQLSDFDYTLPQRLIAQFPPSQRGGSRLLHLPSERGLFDRQFSDLSGLLRAGDLLVLNDTRVIKARMYGQKESGGQVEAMVERVLGQHEVLAMIRASKSPKPGTWLVFAGQWRAQMLGRQGEFFHLRFEKPVLGVLDVAGQLPLPPYIEHVPDGEDAERYQTVFAREPGAVAAPTAGLHFTAAMLDALAQAGIDHARLTLHVGAGTFQPVRVENLAEHRMHHERYQIPAGTLAAIQAARARGGRVVAVGTTSLRALEAACQHGDFAEPEGDTDIFITPGYQFRAVDSLITNFHLPKSTLLMLVSAFMGYDRMRAAYAHAVAAEYRFFSYGDAMLLERR